MPINPDAVGTKGEPVEHSLDLEGRPALRPRRGRRRVDPFDELQFTTENTDGHRPAGAADHGRRARRRRRRRHGQDRHVQPGDARARRAGDRRCTGEIPVEGTVSTVGEIVGIYDKGKGAVVVTESVSTDVATGEPLFTQPMSVFIRGEGGWGGDRGPSGAANVAARPRARPLGHLPDPRPTRP